MNKQQLKAEALKAYNAICDPAFKAYQARLAEIEAMPDEIPDTIKQNGVTYKRV